MLTDMNNQVFFCDYYKQWVDVYKKGAIREATMSKYLMSQKWIEKLAPELKLSELTRTAYQKLLNDYAKEHERQTTLDFHHQLKGAILDCKKCGISEISIHGLRHTHASLLLFAGVSIASVARRLGHASMTTTQKTYLHIIQELENKDVDLVMRTLSGL